MKAKEIFEKYCDNYSRDLCKEDAIDAMIEYAKAKAKEQREICSNKCVGIWTESELVDRVLECETPDF